MKTSFTYEEVIEKFDGLSFEEQNKILKRALKLSLNAKKASTYQAVITSAMGYQYAGDGKYSLIYETVR